jgi:hypothetical protein
VEVGSANQVCGGVVQLVRTAACHAGGRRFESRRSRLFHSCIILKETGALPT